MHPHKSSVSHQERCFSGEGEKSLFSCFFCLFCFSLLLISAHAKERKKDRELAWRDTPSGGPLILWSVSESIVWILVRLCRAARLDKKFRSYAACPVAHFSEYVQFWVSRVSEYRLRSTSWLPGGLCGRPYACSLSTASDSLMQFCCSAMSQLRALGPILRS